MVLHREPVGPVPETTRRLHLAGMVYEPMLDTVIDEETYAGFLPSVRDQLANPAYSTVSPE